MPWLVVSSGWIARGVGVLSRLLLIIWLLDYLGKDQYVVFAVLLSLEGWLAFSDFGLGGSAQNQIAKIQAHNLPQDSALASIAQTGILFFFLSLSVLSCASSWITSFLFATRGFYEQAFCGIIVAITSYCCLSLGSLAYKVLYAQHRGYLVHWLQILGSTLAMTTAYALKQCYTGEHQFLFSTLSVMSLPAIVALCTFFKVFGTQWLWQSWSFSRMKELMDSSWQFFIFGLSNIAVQRIDYLILSRQADSDTILTYHIVSRLFLGFFVMHAGFMQAIWPICSSKISQGQVKQIYTLLKQCCLYGAVFVFLITIAIFYGASIFCPLFFSQYALYFPVSIVSLLGLYYLARAFSDPYELGLVSMGKLQPLLICIPIQAAIAFISESYLIEYYGIQGLIIGLIASHLCTVSWILPWKFYKKSEVYAKNH